MQEQAPRPLAKSEKTCVSKNSIAAVLTRGRFSAGHAIVYIQRGICQAFSDHSRQFIPIISSTQYDGFRARRAIAEEAKILLDFLPVSRYNNACS